MSTGAGEGGRGGREGGSGQGLGGPIAGQGPAGAAVSVPVYLFHLGSAPVLRERRPKAASSNRVKHLVLPGTSRRPGPQGLFHSGQAAGA